MPTIGFETAISAPVEVCFDLARSRSACGLDAWYKREGDCREAKHFMVRQRLKNRIVAFNLRGISGTRRFPASFSTTSTIIFSMSGKGGR